MGQLSLFEQEPQPKQEHKESGDGRIAIKLGRRVARVPLRRWRTESIAKLLPLLKEIEGQDVYITSYDPDHYWIESARLSKIQVHTFGEALPGVIWLRGTRGSVRIFTDYLHDIRLQDYDRYWCILLDFWQGFALERMNPYRPHYGCLILTILKSQRQQQKKES